MPYNYVTLPQASDDLNKRLYNSTFWTGTERIAYIKEAIRTWNAFSNYYRMDFILTLEQGTIWYDITDFAVAPQTLRPIDLPLEDLYKDMQYALLEPASGSIWTGSTQFSANDMTSAVYRRRDEVVSITGCTVKRQTPVAVSGRIFLDDKTIDIRRMAWLPVQNPNGFVNSPMYPDDAFSMSSYDPSFTVDSPDTPSTYRRSTEPPLSFDVNCEPAVPGNYEVMSVDAGTNPATVLNIPNDFAWLVKFGALADLLNRDSLARDPFRAAYCNLRYKQGVQLLYNASAVLQANILGYNLSIEGVTDLDHYRPGWQAEAQNQPDSMPTAGMNMVGFAPAPDHPYDVIITCVQNAPVLDAAPIQIGRDDYDVILDYAQHLASFKQGGQEFQETVPLFQRFMTKAALYNSKLDELGPYTKDIFEWSQRQDEVQPVYSMLEPDTEEK